MRSPGAPHGALWETMLQGIVGSMRLHVSEPRRARRLARKTWVRIPQAPDATQHTSGRKLLFAKDHEPNNVSIAKWAGPYLDPGFGLLASSARTRPTQRGAPGGDVVRIESEINVVPALQVDAMRD